MKRIISASMASAVVAFLLASCSEKSGHIDDILKGRLYVQVNPYERVPLGGQLTFTTTEECKVEITVDGKIPVIKEFPYFSTSHKIPVLGLYADTTNLIRIKLTTRDGEVFNGEVNMKTEALPDFFPTVDITMLDRSKMEPGMHFFEMLIANNGLFHSYTIMFDDNGAIRWYMDLSSMGQITYTAMRIKSGNWMYLNWIDLYELSDLGEEISKEQMWNYAGNHHIAELENGDLLMGGSQKDATVIRNGREVVTRFDFAVQWSRQNRRPVKGWDIGAVLDVDRSVYPEDYSLNFASDWFHVNSIERSMSDNSLLISGRNQGVIKVDNENNLNWIFAPKREWGKAGRSRDGHNTADFLLTAVDSTGKPFPENVQIGDAGTEEFEWSTGQHSITLLENGNMVLFDNGLYRNFVDVPSYSRAVEYAIDEENMTVRQVWEYGKSRGLEMYSPITSDVDVLPTTGNRLITAGNVRLGKKPPHAKMIEITYPGNEEVFEAEIYFKDAKGTGEKSWAQFDLVFKGERYPLYSR